MLLCYSVHVVFGHVISGQDLIVSIESTPCDEKSRPVKPITVSNCGELVPEITSKGKRVAQPHFTFNVHFGRNNLDKKRKTSVSEEEGELKKSKKSKKKHKKHRKHKKETKEVLQKEEEDV